MFAAKESGGGLRKVDVWDMVNNLVRAKAKEQSDTRSMCVVVRHNVPCAVRLRVVHGGCEVAGGEVLMKIRLSRVVCLC